MSDYRWNTATRPAVPGDHVVGICKGGHDSTETPCEYQPITEADVLELVKAVAAAQAEARELRQRLAATLPVDSGLRTQIYQLEAELPLMAEATFVRLYDQLDITDHPIVELGGQRFRVTDTDEHGLPVIPREPGMPEGAKYRLTWIMQADAAGGEVEYTDSLPLALEANRSGAVSERIEDYRESGQEGKE